MTTRRIRIAIAGATKISTPVAHEITSIADCVSPLLRRSAPAVITSNHMVVAATIKVKKTAAARSSSAVSVALCKKADATPSPAGIANIFTIAEAPA
jgi:hypothetical protein